MNTIIRLRIAFALAVCLELAAVSLLPAAAGAASWRSDASRARFAGIDVNAVRSGAPAWRETFRRDDDSWYIGSDANGSRSLADGALTINAAAKNSLLWSAREGNESDFYLEVDTAHVQGPLDNLFGVAFRMQDAQNFYVYSISSDGYYSLGKYVDDEWTALVDWTESDLIDSGRNSENRIGLAAVGNEIVLLVNNVEIDRVQDGSFGAGQIGLLVGATNLGGPTIAFDNLWLWRAKATQKATPVARPTATPAATRPSTVKVQGGNASVTSESLNVRSGPGTGYPVVAALKRGDRVQIVGRTAASDWVKISLADSPEAWVASRYLEPDGNLQAIAVVSAPAPPPTATPRADVAYLVIENHIGRHITVQVNDQNFRVEGKVGDKPGTYTFILQGVGRYRVAAQLPNAGSHNWDLYVEPTSAQCANRQGCVAIGATFVQTYY